MQVINIKRLAKEMRNHTANPFEAIQNFLGGTVVEMEDLTIKDPLLIKKYPHKGLFAIVIPVVEDEIKRKALLTHAIGHLLLKHYRNGGERTEGGVTKWLDPHDAEMDKEVFIFIKEYLLPAEKLKQAAGMMQLSNSKKLEGYLDLIEPLAETFGVDTAVMEDRMKEVGLI